MIHPNTTNGEATTISGRRPIGRSNVNCVAITVGVPNRGAGDNTAKRL